MRADQPVRCAASPTFRPSIGRSLTEICQGWPRRLRLARPRSAVLVLEADDVVEVRRRDLEDRCVLDRGDAVNGSGWVVEARPLGDHLSAQDRLPRFAELELRAAALDIPALVLLVVELEAQRLAGPDEEDLPDVEVGVRPDQLPAPRLVDAARLEGPAVEATKVRRVDTHPTRRRGCHSGFSDMKSSARRRSFGVFTVSQTPRWR